MSFLIHVSLLPWQYYFEIFFHISIYLFGIILRMPDIVSYSLDHFAHSFQKHKKSSVLSRRLHFSETLTGETVPFWAHQNFGCRNRVDEYEAISGIQSFIV